MGFALVGVLMVAGSLNLREIVVSQSGGIHEWLFLPLFPLFLVYLISGVAETNRSPFDVAEGESEIVAGFHVDYSGMGFAVFFLAEYANMILISSLTVIMFLGGWLAPVEIARAWIPGIFWFFGNWRQWRFCFSGFARRSHGTVMTRSCAWGGKCLFRSPWYGLPSSGSRSFYSDWTLVWLEDYVDEIPQNLVVGGTASRSLGDGELLLSEEIYGSVSRGKDA